MSNRETTAGAPLTARLLAFAWDYLLIAGYLALLVGLSSAARPQMTQWFGHGPGRAELAGFTLLTLPVYLYFALTEGSRGRATWGKRRMGLRVTDERGLPAGLGRSLLRSALKFLPWELGHFAVWRMVLPSDLPEPWIYALLAAVYGLVILYLLSPALNRRRRTIYDLLSGTAVRRQPEGDPDGTAKR